MTNEIPAVRLLPKRDKRVAAGHPWVFSNEIDGDVKALPPGGTVDVFDSRGKHLGRGYANPKSLICIRLLSRRRKEDIDHPAFYVDRLLEAKRLRELLYPDRTALRVVFSEADGLPGLVLDRYDDVITAQISTLGMEVRKPLLEEAIRTVYSPRGVVLRNEAPVRTLEGLERTRGVWWGDVPDEVAFDEGGVRFTTAPLGGQKTGHFFDQFDNKRWAASRCEGQTVLDVYANTGGWALHALKAGATFATTVDSDGSNADRAMVNAEANGVADRLQSIHGEGKKVLQALVGEGQRFGVVVLDPPAFAKQRKAVSSALRGYREINTLGLTVVEHGGMFFTSTCSWHILEDRFLDEVHKAARAAGKRIRMVYRGGQASDHPVLPGVPETRYLKCFGFVVHTGA